MTATQLALGIFFGFGALEVAKVGLAMFYEKQKRQAMVRDLQETADGFIEKMHKEVMAERAATTKPKRVRKPAPKSVPKRVVKNLPKAAPAKKPVVSKSQQRRVAATKGGKR